MARLLFVALALSACGGSPLDEQSDELSASTAPHLLPLREPGESARPTPAGKLQYYGGRVLANPEVVAVLWGAGVAPEVARGIGPFYAAAVESSYIDWLSEYDTTLSPVGGGKGSGQHLGRGKLVATVSLPARGGSVVTDAVIQRALSAGLTAGALPKPGPDTVYMVSLPRGVSVEADGGRSCQAGGFCAYHGSFRRKGMAIAYGVLPDLGPGSGCETGCGSAKSVFDRQTQVASHELIEAITDPDVGLAGSALGKPLAWYDANGGEIGDLCNGQRGTLRAKGGKSFTVQKEWSNAAHACIVARGSRGAADDAPDDGPP